MRAHVAENQLNDYLEHATNTEHASLIIHTPPTNIPFGGQGLAIEKHVTKARYKHRARQPYYTPSPNKRPPSVDRG